ncbi:MAG: fructose 1,6-bisphosphatase [Chloroflexi bacterium]|nr:fructose 1,6-bisphosphatase [Chloroflexota bacterium]
MRLTLSILKADIGSPGGHTRPARAVRDEVKRAADAAIERGLLIDAIVTHTGDDIAITCSHTRGANATEVHQFAWDAFVAGTAVAQRRGDYAAGQDLLVDAPSGNIRGAGPAVAEVDFDHDPVKTNNVRPAESVLFLFADKCGPGAYNLPLFLAMADPMFCGGLLLKPEMSQGFTFRIMDMDCTDGDRLIDLHAPEDYYRIVALLRDETRFAIDSVWSRAFPDQQVAAASTSRLHNIAGKYVGKDDPVAIIRNQGIFAAPEELLLPWAICPYVTGDARGSHVMPITPMPINSEVRFAYCQPIVSAIGCSLDAEGRFSSEITDFFADPLWEDVRKDAVRKGLAMRRQGWFGAAMAHNAELAYTGLVTIQEGLESRFVVRHGADARATAAAGSDGAAVPASAATVDVAPEVESQGKQTLAASVATADRKR